MHIHLLVAPFLGTKRSRDAELDPSLDSCRLGQNMVTEEVAAVANRRDLLAYTFDCSLAWIEHILFSCCEIRLLHYAAANLVILKACDTVPDESCSYII